MRFLAECGRYKKKEGMGVVSRRRDKGRTSLGPVLGSLGTPMLCLWASYRVYLMASCKLSVRRGVYWVCQRTGADSPGVLEKKKE